MPPDEIDRASERAKSQLSDGLKSCRKLVTNYRTALSKSTSRKVPKEPTRTD